MKNQIYFWSKLLITKLVLVYFALAAPVDSSVKCLVLLRRWLVFLLVFCSLRLLPTGLGTEDHSRLTGNRRATITNIYAWPPPRLPANPCVTNLFGSLWYTCSSRLKLGWSRIKINVTSALIFCSSTSASLSLISLSLTSPLLINVLMSFLVLSNGSICFLSPVWWYEGSFSLILASMLAMSLFFRLRKLLILSLAVLSFTLTISTS